MADFVEAYDPYFTIGLVSFLACGFLFLLVRSLIWVYRDAEERGKPGWAVALLVVMCKWPVSLLMWLVIRPETHHSHNGN